MPCNNATAAGTVASAHTGGSRARSPRLGAASTGGTRVTSAAQHKSPALLKRFTLRLVSSSAFLTARVRASELLQVRLESRNHPPCFILSHRLVSQSASARPRPPPAPPRMRLAAAVLLLVAACGPASAFPVYSSANGTVLVRSAFGGDVVFAPSAGGALQARCARRALP